MRPRTKLIRPRPPGGFLDDPPDGCPNAVSYCPSPAKYESIMVVEYVRCSRKSCSLPIVCQRRLEADKGLLRRLQIQRGVEENGHS